MKRDEGGKGTYDGQQVKVWRIDLEQLEDDDACERRLNDTKETRGDTYPATKRRRGHRLVPFRL